MGARNSIPGLDDFIAWNPVPAEKPNRAFASVADRFVVDVLALRTSLPAVDLRIRSPRFAAFTVSRLTRANFANRRDDRD
jgi:hypothetical protein